MAHGLQLQAQEYKAAADKPIELIVFCTSPPGTVFCAFSGSFGTRFFWMSRALGLQPASPVTDMDYDGGTSRRPSSHQHQ